MYTFQLKKFIAKKLPEKNISVVSRDGLPISLELPAGFIINQSGMDEEGSHWVAL
jgi:hypothetical protein